jgi:hypothetical protein
MTCYLARCKRFLPLNRREDTESITSCRFGCARRGGWHGLSPREGRVFALAFDTAFEDSGRAAPTAIFVLLPDERGLSEHYGIRQTCGTFRSGASWW